MYKEVWEKLIKQERTKMIFQEEKHIVEFVKNSTLTQLQMKEKEILIKLKSKGKEYVFQQRDGRWSGYPSNAFVEYGMALKCMFPIFDKLIKKIKEPN